MPKEPHTDESESPSLSALGWTPQLQEWADEQDGDANAYGRIARADRGFCQVFTGSESVLAASSSVRSDTGMVPTTGDFVILAEGENRGKRELVISAIAERRTELSRRSSGVAPQPQLLAANIDAVIVMHSLERPLNHWLVERHLVAAWQSGAEPIILLSKSDACTDAEAKVKAIQAIAPNVEVIACSTLDGHNMDQVKAYFRGSFSAALLGQSGIGKSTLVNTLMGREVQKIGEVRAIDKEGRHTTVSRDLIVLPGGGLIIDTPGIRELFHWQAYEGIAKTFPEISTAAVDCEFSDCAHRGEPDCAVALALAEGRVAEHRFEHWQEVQDEMKAQDKQIEEFQRRSESRDRADMESKHDKERLSKRARGKTQGRKRARARRKSDGGKGGRGRKR